MLTDLEDDLKIISMEAFIKYNTELDFNITSKGKQYYSLVGSVLEMIKIDNIEQISKFLAEKLPNTYGEFQGEEDVKMFILEDLPKAPSRVRKLFATELKNIKKADDYIKFVNRKLGDPNLDKPSEEDLLLKKIFGDDQENETENTNE